MSNIVYKDKNVVVFKDLESASEDWDEYDDDIQRVWLGIDNKGKQTLKTSNKTGKEVLFKDNIKYILNIINNTKVEPLNYVELEDKGAADYCDEHTKELAHAIHNKIVEIFHLSSEERSEKMTLLAIMLFAKSEKIKADELHEYATNLNKNSLNYKDQFEDKDLNDIYKDIIDFDGDIKVLYDEIFKYGQKKEFKNSEFTPKYVSELITDALKVILKKDKVKPSNLTIYEPCAGLCNLTNAFIKNIPDNIPLNLIASENVTEIAILSDAVNNINKNRKFDIRCETFDESIVNSLQCDICLLNPPFSEKTVTGAIGEKHYGTSVLKFIMLAAACGKYSISIFPENILVKAKESTKVYLKELINMCDIPIILRLGNKVFFKGSKPVGTGNIIVLITKQKEEPIETDFFTSRVYNLDINSCFKTKIRNGKELTEEGSAKLKEIIENITNETAELETFDFNNVNNWFKEEIPPAETIKNKMKLSENLSEIQVLKYKLCADKLSEKAYESSVNYEIDFRKCWNLQENKFIKVRLMDYFEVVKGKKHNIDGFVNELGIYNFISSRKFDNGVVGKCDIADYTNVPLYTLNVNGSIGFLFKHTEPFSCSGDVKVLKSIRKIPNEKFNLELISLQLNNSGFGFTNKLNVDVLDNIEVLIYDHVSSSSD